MRIRIIGKLPDHVKDMGVKVNQVYDAHEAPDTTLDARRFRVVKDGQEQYCTVLPANYKEV